MTNEPNGIGLAHTGGIERPQPARVAYETAEDIQDQELSVDQPAMVRLFTEANGIINGERQQTYGPPTESFQRIAAFWSAYTGVKLNEVDVVYMMQLVTHNEGETKEQCRFCKFYTKRTELNGIYHYKQNGKSKYGIWHPTGFYCKLHIWDAIYQDGELSRYRRWERKYFDAIQKFLDRENKKVVADANSN